MEKLLKSLEMKDIAAMMGNIDSFIELFNKKEAVLLDTRYSFEIDAWSFSFSVNIPLNEIPDRLDEIPKDKVIFCACPLEVRSNIACQYLLTKGYDAKFLVGGLVELANKLRGGAAKSIDLS